MPDAQNMILQQLLAGQTAIELRLLAIETTLAEKRGERRMGLWLLGLGSGAIGAYLTGAVKSLMGHP